MSKAPVKCLFCGHKHMVKDIEEHVSTVHVLYQPHKCNDCDFASTSRSELREHTHDTDHNGSQHIDPYKEWLVNCLVEDIQYAAKYGIEELHKKKGISLVVPPSSSSSSISGSPSLRKQPPVTAPSPVSIQSPVRRPVEESSSEDDEPPPPKAAKKTVPEVQKRRSDNRQREDSNEGGSEDNKYQEIREFRKANEKYAECTLCREKILIGFDKRQAHIHDEHMGDVPEGKGYETRLETRTKEAFPGLVWNARLCFACKRIGKDHEISSIDGRISHVITYHCKTPLHCPKTGCPYKDVKPSNFTKHFADKHATEHWKTMLPDCEQEFHTTFAKHKSNLHTISKLIFPVDFPNGASSVKSKRRTSENDDESEDRAALARMKAAAPSRPTPQPAAKKTRRSPSPEEEDDDSGDEKPASSRKKEKERIVIDGKLVEASDDEEESETERESREDREEEMDMDIDDKEEARSRGGSSICSSAATTGGDSRREDYKRESTSDVKTEDEIKEEPVTPSTRRRPVLLPTPSSSAFTGRHIQGPIRDIHPSSERAADQRREARWRDNGKGKRGGRGGSNSGFDRRGGRGGGGGARYDRGGLEEDGSDVMGQDSEIPRFTKFRETHEGGAPTVRRY